MQTGCAEGAENSQMTNIKKQIQVLFTFKLKSKDKFHRTFNSWQYISLIGILMRGSINLFTQEL